ncbi:hypothetical protein M513_13193 [Trichuris suis]|uniref:Uncharacterized protein n=1 Tax=Trichuris suis TaxID=68888 RepID=A0A085LLT8_9BILA|nr:hypothetical protein M513_13193 [Trichuris suis]
MGGNAMIKLEFPYTSHENVLGQVFHYRDFHLHRLWGFSYATIKGKLLCNFHIILQCYNVESWGSIHRVLKSVFGGEATSHSYSTTQFPSLRHSGGLASDFLRVDPSININGQGTEPTAGSQTNANVLRNTAFGCA